MCLNNKAPRWHTVEDMLCEKDFMDWPGGHTVGRIAGTGTAVGGTGTSELGCQLRWRFLGGPEIIVKDPENKTQTPEMKPEWHKKKPGE